MRRKLIFGIVVVVLAFALGCTNKKSNNPLANVGSKQPDKVLFDRSMDAMKHNHFDVARMTLQTLINTYPDSEYIARAKLAVADSWYAEGGSTAMQQAEIEYKDFKTFFPNMPEAAEAQMRVGDIHYQEMEKPDRDFTHAVRAEEEYRAMINEYPDSKLVPKAKQRLREVQEVLAQREYNIGQFYYLRLAYPAAIARLKTLTDRYPLYSAADQALYLLGQSYEAEIDMVRKNPRTGEVMKAKMIEDLTKHAADAYGRIIRRYPAMDRAVDAKERLEAMHQPVPRPTRAALDLNKKEIASRDQTSTLSSVMATFEKHPQVGNASRIGEPTMVDQDPVTATEVIKGIAQAAGAMGDSGKLSATIVNAKGASNEQPPRSENPTAAGDTTPASASDSVAATDAASANELKPNVPDPNELKPNVDADPNPLPPLQQSNQLDSANGASSSTQTASAAGSSKEEMADISSSKKKKKKGIKKLNPF